MYEFLKVSTEGKVGIITLNRPDVLNAWHSPMRRELAAALEAMNADEEVRAVIMTGAGERAFSAGQDLNETKSFDTERAREWVEEWRALYSAIRGMTKPLIAALNGVAAGSAFQVALQCDIRVGHAGSKMGQPEINSGIASTLGPWLMKEMLGLSRTIELTLTGRMMDGEECHHIGLIHHLVAADQVHAKAMEVAGELAEKPPVAMALNKRRFAEMTQPGFEDALAAGSRNQKEAYASGEPQRMMEAFFAEREKRKQNA
ncbi:MAG: enoyl-CoA hydratase/isomerase family protein [Pseudomonadota bacterium]|uniref:enoyl-CoA hydratase/isomerase family protein n=1 Tax=Fodinicurvata fenggangensis TaxID=1121830 RepID=UPI00047E7E12|nr:enoyl-CoA hydratase/isomerase family protein [Fodinicurvata fenggangensis]